MILACAMDVSGPVQIRHPNTRVTEKTDDTDLPDEEDEVQP